MNIKEKTSWHRNFPAWGAGILLPVVLAAGLTACGKGDEKVGRAEVAAATPAERDVVKSSTSRASTTPRTTVTTTPPTTPAPPITTVTETARVETVERTAAPSPDTSRAQSNAVRAAKDYLAIMAFSRSGLIVQLEFEGYSTADATRAVDQVSPNWNEQAALSAESYLELMAFSRSGLIEQLEFDGFDRAQATYGVNQVGL